MNSFDCAIMIIIFVVSLLLLSFGGGASAVLRHLRLLGIADERQALVNLYDSTQDVRRKWTRFEGWATKTADHCGWYGVECDDDGSVTRLDLEKNRLRKILPDLSALTSLEILELGDNKIGGTLPDLGALTSLVTLFLDKNQFTGTLDLGALTSSLEYLNELGLQ